LSTKAPEYFTLPVSFIKFGLWITSKLFTPKIFTDNQEADFNANNG